MTRPGQALRTALRGMSRVLLTGPSDTDGDSIGACLAFQRWLSTAGVSVDVAGTISPRYRWMPGVDGMISDPDLTNDYDAVVVLDGDRLRLPPRTTAKFEQATLRGIVDHHASTTTDGYTHPWLEPQATSTCEMLYGAMKAEQFPIDRDLATWLYVGAIFDTGGFRYSNTTPATHRMAAELLETGIDHAQITIHILMERAPQVLRIVGRIYEQITFHCQNRVAIGLVSRAMVSELASGDLEGVVNDLLYLEGVEVSALITEKPDGSSKVSLRSRGKINVAEVARQLSSFGGGHIKAAGATVAASPAEVQNQLLKRLDILN